ncbi:hypothetical protein Y032_0267g733 [Ancylostoma ceylanicum]|uniref:Uncharacterized protein n=1 Tax=Ancylostoma ceylanicum TaxID=53326 RepID=A0A016S9W2_9BILA|nr:hypothetical protein Y032_0267g733 [Ancylostoma ceylanicum]
MHYGISLISSKPHTRVHNSAAVVLPRLIQCDGACNTWAPEDYIIQFGLCDHNICFRCYENEESIALTNDGKSSHMLFTRVIISRFQVHGVAATRNVSRGRKLSLLLELQRKHL